MKTQKAKHKYIYFNNASSTPDYTKIINPNYFFEDDFQASTLKIHQKSIKNKTKVEEARILTANLLKIAPNSLFFTPNGTYANNLAINSIPQSTKAAVSSIFEHPSVLITLKNKCQQLNIPLLYVDLEQDSGINLQNFKKLLQKHPYSFISLSHINRLTGRQLPISRISKICHKNKSIFHSDMSHSLAKYDINLKKLGVDMVTSSGTTLGAKPGVGFIFSKIKIKPIIFGAKNEYSIVPGSENIEAITSFANTLKFFSEKHLFYKDKATELKNYLKNNLDKKKIEYKTYGFSETHFSPYMINLELPQINDINNLLIKLDLNNFAIGNGTSKKQNMQKNILLSFNIENNKYEIEQFVSILKNLLN